MPCGLILVALGFFLAGIFLPSGIIYSRDLVKPELILPAHYPDGFDGWGQIDRIDINENEVVIDDCLMRLSPYAAYHIPSRSNASSALFRAGSVVGFLKGSDGSIISMWLIK